MVGALEKSGVENLKLTQRSTRIRERSRSKFNVDGLGRILKQKMDEHFNA